MSMGGVLPGLILWLQLAPKEPTNIEMKSSDALYETVERLQEILQACALYEDADDPEYVALRRQLVADSSLRNRLPMFVQSCRNLDQFRLHLDNASGTFSEHRCAYVWDQFRPILDELEWPTNSPVDDTVSEILATFDPEHVRLIWQKALSRRMSDPEGAITIARTLLETVCKHILDERNVAYSDREDLPKLYHLTAQELQLAPGQYQEDLFKQILGGCYSVVNGLPSLRNRMSDSHGQGKLHRVKPAARHAELAVNLAGSVALFLTSTWLSREEHRSNTLDNPVHKHG